MSKLEEAIRKGDLELVKQLIENGENLNFQHLGQTPLQLSIQLKEYNIAKEILRHDGLQLDLKDTSQKTALHMAVEKGNLELVEKLVEKGANLNIKEENGRTPLHMALSPEKGMYLSNEEKTKINLHKIKIAKFLVEKGAKYNINNNKGIKAVKIIVDRGLKDILAEIVKKELEKNKKRQVEVDEFAHKLKDYMGVKEDEKLDEAIEKFIKIKEGEDSNLSNIEYEDIIRIGKIYQYNNQINLENITNYTPITQDEMESILKNNKPIYVRSIRGLTGVIKENSDKEDFLRMKYNETGVMTEVRKLIRKEGINTRTKIKGVKKGNPNRCFTLVTYGKVIPFTSVGYGTTGIDTERIHLVAEHDVYSKIDKEQGIINRNFKIKEDDATSTENLETKQKIENLMQTIKQATQNLGHNEVIMDVSAEDAKFIYYINKNENDINKETENYNKLQALYFKRKYKEMTGIDLPIYEYKLNKDMSKINERFLVNLDFANTEIEEMIKKELVRSENGQNILKEGYNNIEAADFLLTFKDEIKNIPECREACESFCKTQPPKMDIYGIINFVKLVKEFGNREIDNKKLVDMLKERINTHYIDVFLQYRTERRGYTNKRENRKLDFWLYTVSQMEEVFDKEVMDNISANIVDTTKGIYRNDKLRDDRNRTNVGIILSNLLLTKLKEGNTEIAEFLIKQGVDVNVKDENGNTPLMCACMTGKKDLSKLLIEHGANVNDKNNVDFSAIHYCSRNIEMAKLLIENGADVNNFTKNGDTILKMAIMNRDEKLVKLLIDSGANVNFEERLGESALILGVKTNNKNIVKMLLRNNAEINVVDRNKLAPIEIAEKNKNQEIKEILEHYMSKEKHTNIKEVTPKRDEKNNTKTLGI